MRLNRNQSHTVSIYASCDWMVDLADNQPAHIVDIDIDLDIDIVMPT
jgi:hypothetical protein